MTKRLPITEDMPVDVACDILAANLPEDWELEIYVSEGCGSVTLRDSHGHVVNYPCNFDNGIHGEMECALACAQETAEHVAE